MLHERDHGKPEGRDVQPPLNAVARLRRLLERLVYAPSSIRRALQQKFGVTLTRADAYAEIPTIADVERSFAAPSGVARRAPLPRAPTAARLFR